MLHNEQAVTSQGTHAKVPCGYGTMAMYDGIVSKHFMRFIYTLQTLDIFMTFWQPSCTLAHMCMHTKSSCM